MYKYLLTLSFGLLSHSSCQSLKQYYFLYYGRLHLFATILMSL